MRLGGLEILISAPALAIDAAYLGFWALSPEGCNADDRNSFRLTSKGISGRELECETKQASSDGSGWRMRLWCGSEGSEYFLDVRWQLMPNGRLHETQKGKAFGSMAFTSWLGPTVPVSVPGIASARSDGCG